MYFIEFDSILKIVYSKNFRKVFKSNLVELFYERDVQHWSIKLVPGTLGDLKGLFATVLLVCFLSLKRALKKQKMFFLEIIKF